ncbi:alpha-L-rhamnosidase C-terminal domain-containing protein [Plebeiibacterium marinum]|uniref:Alpha-L-rhamnosidase n=1 Tax=Plebeiibacterium marinum TaxID=2992111 RepID=A0AAE3SIL3_9BACT|nr:alpha-L-rhamnosidase C-terminal domain-containing protein [Plebeiobacterium marinum]MCW3804519.1 hypothetical protein [Plebeiobacterium marinum]
MRTLKTFFVVVVVLMSFTFKSQAQMLDSAFLYNKWKANWIKVPGTEPNGYGVYYFRKKVEFNSIPKECPIYVSGDNRYKLYVNEKLVSVGPARGDKRHWNFEIIDIVPYLIKGNNIIAAVVWNDGEYRPTANISNETGFILQSGVSVARSLNTGSSWLCIQDKGYSPIKINLPTTSYRTGPGEKVDMEKSIRDFNKFSCDETDWVVPEKIGKGNDDRYGVINGWNLMPSYLPAMELKNERLKKLRKVDGFNIPEKFPDERSPFTIPKNTKGKFILDQTYLTNAYLNLEFSQGKGANISICYAETLYDDFPLYKGNRNIVEGKQFIGREDKIHSDGTINQMFSTLFWRTYRYIQIEIETKDDPLIIEDVYGTFTGYPFEKRSKLETSDYELLQIENIGWRTARLCAFDTYFDCPYYEQLQYIGDTRIQALISVYNSGDDRLFKRAINLLDQSRIPEGLTLSRYPANEDMLISPFSVYYIGMLHDYMMYRPELKFVQDKLPGARQILHYYKQHQQLDGSVKNLSGWLFTDWVNAQGWNSTGECKLGDDGCSSILDLQLLYAYEMMSELEENVGMKAYVALYKKEIEALKNTIRHKYWDKEKGLFADRYEKDGFSQHANILAIITEVVDGEEATNIAQKILTDKTLAKASVYFKYYLHQALIKAGLGNDYLNWLDVWNDNIDWGLTTWAEISDLNDSRSDCHAWGASPNIEFFRTVLGIDSDAPEFAKIKIEPHLGDIREIGGEMPHPKGKIKVHYTVIKNKLKASVVLPIGTTGRIIWNGKEYELKGGDNILKL